jgi:hypothetical protein
MMIYQEDIIVVNIYTANIRASKYVMQILKELIEKEIATKY